MKLTRSIKNALSNMKESISRYPLVLIATIAIAILNAMLIERPQQDYTRLLLTFLIGALLSMVAQAIYEHFLKNDSQRYILMTGAITITIGYYFIVGPQANFNIPLATKTSIALFALLITYIWIPSIDSTKISFHQTFLILVKAFFTTLLFTLVLIIGINTIYYATDYLLFSLDYDILLHLMNIIVSVFSPLLFLAMIPTFPSREQALVPSESWSSSSQALSQSLVIPRFFNVLLSYIIIPLIAVYTLILVAYIGINISGAFWIDNLLEPLLVSYTIIVILVLILSFNIDNRFTKPFQAWFPKILVPIVVFQTLASFLKIQESGLTHGRYYVILFGIYATISALAYSILKERGHRFMVISLLVAAIISIIPPIDAFTVSKTSQINLLEEKLFENNMYENQTIVPNNTIATEDKITITRTVSYLNQLDYFEDVAVLPAEFNFYSDFEAVFGFPRTFSDQQYTQDDGYFLYVDWDGNLVLEVSDYDSMIFLDYYYSQSEDIVEDPITFTVDGESYELIMDSQDTHHHFIVNDSRGNQLIDYDTKELYDYFFGTESETTVNQQFISLEEASLIEENENIRLNIVVSSLQQYPRSHNGSMYLLIEIK